MGKSAEVIDKKGVGMAPLRKRVLNRMETKEMEETVDFAEEAEVRSRYMKQNPWALQKNHAGHKP